MCNNEIHVRKTKSNKLAFALNLDLRSHKMPQTASRRVDASATLAEL